MTDENCSTCRYGRDARDGLINCRRNPVYVRRKSKDWCGEYTPADGENQTNRRSNKRTKAVSEKPEEEH